MTDKHLLWWVFKAIHACRAQGTTIDTLLSETVWKNIGAPDWVLAAIEEKYAAFAGKSGPVAAAPAGGGFGGEG